MADTQRSSSPITIDRNGQIKIYFSDFVKGFMRFWWVCVAMAVLFGGVGFVRSYRSFRPKYTVTATFTISTQNSTTSIGGVSVYSFFYDSTTAGQLADTFPYLLTSNLMQDAVCEKLGLDYIPASVTATSVPGSNLFTLTATGREPQSTYDVMQAVLECYPDVAKYVVGNTKFVMITPPELPEGPSNKADYVRDAGKMAALGFGFGLIFIVISALLRRTVRTAGDVENDLHIALLGSLPRVSFKRSVSYEDRNILINNPKLSSSYPEALRLLQNTLINKIDDKNKVILVTSTAPGEGKTTVAANISSLLGEYGKNVLLIDGDTRNPSVAPLLRVDMEKAETVTENDRYKIAKLDSPRIRFLDFKADENGRKKRIGTEEMREIIASVRDDYDCIVVDTPPCGLVSDTLYVAQSADSAIYVVMQDTVRVSRILDGIDNLLSSDVKLLGCVLNGVQSGVTGYGYGYGRYGYGYKKYGKYGRYSYSSYGEQPEKRSGRSRKDKSK